MQSEKPKWYVRVLVVTLALLVFAIVGYIGGKFMQYNYPTTGFNGRTGAVVSMLFFFLSFVGDDLLKEYIQTKLKRTGKHNWYIVLTQMQWITLVWASFGAVVLLLLTTIGEAELNDKVPLQVLYLMLSGVALRLCIAIKRWSMKQWPAQAFQRALKG